MLRLRTGEREREVRCRKCSRHMRVRLGGKLLSQCQLATDAGTRRNLMKTIEKSRKDEFQEGSFWRIDGRCASEGDNSEDSKNNYMIVVSWRKEECGTSWSKE